MTKPSDNKPISSEQAVAASEERFRALVTATFDVIYSMSPDWSIMRQLDGRGFLQDTLEPITDWQSKNIHPEIYRIFFTKRYTSPLPLKAVF